MCRRICNRPTLLPLTMRMTSEWDRQVGSREDSTRKMNNEDEMSR